MGEKNVRLGLNGEIGMSVLDRDAAPGRDHHAADGVGAPFVGRERERWELEAALDAALAGRGRLYLLVGEPGIGKTRLASETAGEAARRGMEVLWGRCWEGGGAPAYWPWMQVIRAHARASRKADLLRELGTGGPWIAELLPDLRDALPDLAVASHPADSEEARFLFFDAIGVFVRNSSAARALVVILDDVQWADEPSLLLLQFLARNLTDARVLFVAGYRDVEAKLVPEVAGRIAALSSDANVIRLRGLSAPQVGLLIESRGSRLPSAEAIGAVHRATDGNPLFVGELVNLLVAEGKFDRAEREASLPIPDRVREVIRRRLSFVSEECRRILAAAAVLGRDFACMALSDVCRLPAERALQLLSEARTGGFVVEMATAAGRFSFTHDLVRETLYDDLSYGERIELHKSTAETLERLYSADVEDHLTELARHFFAAAAAGTAERAVDYSIRAGDRCARQLASEEAAAHYERALQALELAGSGGDERCLRLWLSLGEVRWWAGRLRDSTAAYERAAEVAQKLGAGAEYAQAAIGLAGRGDFHYGVVDEGLIRVLERGLDGLGDEDGAVGAMLMARLAVALAFSPERERAALLARTAVDRARRVGDKQALQFVLICGLHATWGPDNLDERLATSREVARLGAEIGEAALASGGNTPLFFLEAGDVTAANRESERKSAHSLRCRFCASWAGVGRARRALFEGRFDEVEGLAQQVLAARRELQDEEAADVVFGQLLLLRREEGRLGEIVEDILRLAERYRAVPFWRAALGWVYAELGLGSKARLELERLALAEFTAIPRDMYWLASLAILSEVVIHLGDTRRAGEIYSLLLPYAGRSAVVFGLCFGSVARPLGCLAAMRPELGEAARHFEDALDANRLLGSPPWVAHTEYDYARMLLTRGMLEDREKGLDLLARCTKTARELAMKSLLDKAEALRAGATAARQDEGRPDSPPLAAVVPVASFRREGEFWTIEHQGTVVRMKDVKGLRYIAQLLQHPGREFLAADLISAPAGDSARARHLRGASADAGPLLDAKSTQAYRARLTELRDDLEEAEANNDAGRTEKARAEIEFLTRELSSAIGLGGRRRQAAAVPERIRVVVTKAIRTSLRKLERDHPSLGRLLQRTIRTGTFCSYCPDPDVPILWKL